MARKLTGIAAQRAAEAAALIDASEPSAATEDALDEIVDEGQRRPEARISRLDPISRKYALLDVVDVGVATDSWIRDTYGGGTFYIQVYGIREDGKYGYIKKQSRQVNVDSSIPFKGSIRERVAQGAVRTVEAPGEGDTTMAALAQNQVIQLIREQNETRGSGMTMLTSIMQQGQQQAAAAQQQSQQFMQMMMTLMTAVMQRPAPDSGIKEILPLLLSRKDPVELATQIAALAKGNGPAIGGLGDLETLLEVADRINRRGNGEDISFTGVLKENLPQALGVLEKLAARNAPAPQPVRVNPPAPRPAIATGPTPELAAGVRREVAPPADEPEPTGPIPVADEWTPLEGAMEQLAGFARADKDPYRVVQTVMLFANDIQKAKMRDMVQMPAIADQIVTRFPALAAYPLWLEKFLTELHIEFFGDPDDADDDDDPPEPGADAPAGEPTE